MRPDQPVLHEEARSSIKRALRQYAREQSARDIALYGASIRVTWTFSDGWTSDGWTLAEDYLDGKYDGLPLYLTSPEGSPPRT
ncbi:hypothetical protein [Salinibacter altiplanensis]|uniref:hypothetical protein n=1 Tax=Salinibacter altiplanensis TaxID=1803181 RepID=UPI000C9F38F9|nr:hypothetical protein [Salinibacter altiplanensis]